MRLESLTLQLLKHNRQLSSQLRMTAVAKTYRYLDDEELEAQRPRQQPARRRR